MSEKVSKLAAVILTVVALFGLISVANAIDASTKLSSWTVILSNYLTVIGFIWVCFYILLDSAKSSTFFTAMHITVAVLTVLAAANAGFAPLALVLDLVTLACVVTILFKWRSFRLCKVLSFIAIAASLAASVHLLTVNRGSADAGTVLSIVATFNYFVLVLCVLGCYVARMRQKQKEQ